MAYKSCAFEMNAEPNNKMNQLSPIIAMMCIFKKLADLIGVVVILLS